MIKEELHFRIKIHNGLTNKDISKSLGVKVDQHGWLKVDINSFDIVRSVIESNSKGLFAIERGFFQQDLSCQDSEWFVLETDKLFAWENLDEYPICKADKMPKNLHLSFLEGCHFVSEKFKEIVEINNLTGLEFLWIKDQSKYKAPQWYLAIAQEPICRGIDHDWFTGKPKGGDSWQPLGKFRNSIWSFENSQMKSDILGLGKYEILGLFDNNELSIRSYRTMLRKNLPSKDFAFIWNTEDKKKLKIEKNESESKYFSVGESRYVCLNKKAADILLFNKIISNDNLKGIKIVDEVPNDKQYLDDIMPYPRPFFYNRLEEIKKEEQELLTIFNSNERPIKDIKFNAAIKELKISIKERVDDFEKGANKKQLEILSNLFDATIPRNWIEVLKLTNGGFLSPDLECNIVDVESLISFNKDTNKWYDGETNDFIHIAYSPSGDFYSLDINQSLHGDCPVILTNHESLEVERIWKNIASFINDMIHQE